MNLFHLQSKRTLIFVFLLTIVGAVLHFHNLNWGSPFYFHPDERNIAASVSQLQFPSQMNPNFFAYGSLPIYIIFFTGLLLNYGMHFLNQSPHFEQAILISRFYSALFTTLLIPILFLIGKQLKNEKVGLIGAFLGTASIGLVQFAHFGTFEIWLTFFSTLLLWLCLKKLTKKITVLIGIVFGILVATKISSLALLPIPLLIFILKTFHRKHKIYRNLFTILIHLFLFFIVAGIVYIVTNPFVFLNFAAFRATMDYETSLALGTLPVFYTGEFYNTIPIIFQFLHVYPFLLNPLLTIIFVPSFCYLIVQIIKHKNPSLFILASFFIILFLSQAVLFVKWTRYIVPTLPFVYLIIAFACEEFSNKKREQFSKETLALIFVTCCLFVFSYFVTAFVRPDTRVEAFLFSQKSIPVNAPILSEVYDMGIVPFNQSFDNIVLFHFYDLDNKSPDVTVNTLQKSLAETDYIILPSQRLLKTRLLQKEKYPEANIFYTKLLNGDLGFTKIYETPCDVFCKITYLGDPVFSFEQTANVFDRPTVMIFKKM